jgi:hypothetical protein
MGESSSFHFAILVLHQACGNKNLTQRRKGAKKTQHDSNVELVTILLSAFASLRDILPQHWQRAAILKNGRTLNVSRCYLTSSALAPIIT